MRQQCVINSQTAVAENKGQLGRGNLEYKDVNAATDALLTNSLWQRKNSTRSSSSRVYCSVGLSQSPQLISWWRGVVGRCRQV